MELLDYNLGAGVHAFSTLRTSGGCGQGAYESFNLTPYVNDTSTNVLLSRQQLCETLSLTNEQLILPRQTHSNHVLVIDAAHRALPSQTQTEHLQNVDALVTQEKGLCIGVSTADCVPLLLHDPESRTIAAVHAGWRGMVQRIPQCTLDTMRTL